MPTQAKPRPTRNSPEVIRAAAEKLAPRVAEWADDTSDSSLAEITEDLARELRGEVDAYRIARRLDDRGYYADQELVDILSDAFSYIDRAERAAVKAWTLEYGVSLDLSVGDRVSTRYGEGVIRELWVDDARYTVAVSPEQLAADRSGYLIPAEQVSLVSTGAA